MKLSLSALVSFAAVMRVMASVPLKTPMVLTIVTDWDEGFVTVEGEAPVDIGTGGDPVSLDVDGSHNTYQRVTEMHFDNVDPDNKKGFSISRNLGGQPLTRPVSRPCIWDTSSLSDRSSSP